MINTKLRPAQTQYLKAIDHGTFMRIIAGTFDPAAHEEDILALLKRANMVVFGRRAVYFRPACPTVSHANVIRYPDANDQGLLTGDMSIRMSSYKKGKKVTPPPDDTKWSLMFATRCMRELPVTGFRYEIEHDMTGDKKPEVKEVKPTIESMEVGLNTEAPAYIPGAPASSGVQTVDQQQQPANLDGNNDAPDNNKQDQTACDVHTHEDTHAGVMTDAETGENGAKNKRKFQFLSQEQPKHVIDLDDSDVDIDVGADTSKVIKVEPAEVEVEGADHVIDENTSGQPGTASVGMQIVPASQSDLAFELGRLLSQAPSFLEDNGNVGGVGMAAAALQRGGWGLRL